MYNAQNTTVFPAPTAEGGGRRPYAAIHGRFGARRP
jgi:hypothetical protein